MRDILSDIRRINPVAWTEIGLSERAQQINSIVDKFTSYAYSHLMALQVKSASIVLKEALPVGKQILEQRNEEIIDSIERSFEVLTSFKKEVDSLSRKLSCKFLLLPLPFLGPIMNEYYNEYYEERKNLMDKMEIIDYLKNASVAIQEKLEQNRNEFERPRTLVVFVDKSGHVKDIKVPLEETK